MVQPLRTRRGAPVPFAYLLAPLLPATSAGWAQSCPPAPGACPPGAAPSTSYRFGRGLLDVTPGPVHNTSAGAAEGYQAYSGPQNAPLTAGTNLPIRVQPNANLPEPVGVWLDLNNDGALSTTSELTYSGTGTGAHPGTLQLPATAALGPRLRAAADYVNAPVPGPCSTPQYWQTEDYSVTLSADTTRPVAGFVANFMAAQPLICPGGGQLHRPDPERADQLGAELRRRHHAYCRRAAPPSCGGWATTAGWPYGAWCATKAPCCFLNRRGLPAGRVFRRFLLYLLLCKNFYCAAC